MFDDQPEKPFAEKVQPFFYLLGSLKHLDWKRLFTTDGTPLANTYALEENFRELQKTFDLEEYPWPNITPGRYLCHMHGTRIIEVKVLDGEDDFTGERMYRWFAGTIPGRLLHGMPKHSLLIRIPD